MFNVKLQAPRRLTVRTATIADAMYKSNELRKIKINYQVCTMNLLYISHCCSDTIPCHTCCAPENEVAESHHGRDRCTREIARAWSLEPKPQRA